MAASELQGDFIYWSCLKTKTAKYCLQYLGEDGKMIGQFNIYFFNIMTVDSLPTKKINKYIKGSLFFFFFFNYDLLPRRNKVAFC